MYEVTKEMLEWMNDGNVEKCGEVHYNRVNRVLSPRIPRFRSFR